MIIDNQFGHFTVFEHQQLIRIILKCKFTICEQFAGIFDMPWPKIYQILLGSFIFTVPKIGLYPIYAFNKTTATNDVLSNSIFGNCVYQESVAIQLRLNVFVFY